MDEILNLINNNEWDKAYEILKKNNKLYEPITNGKNLFHFACVRGNKNIFKKLLNSENAKILLSDNDNNSGAHFLAINGFDELLYNLCKINKEFLKLKNNEDKTVIDYLLDRNDILIKIFDLIEKYKFFDIINYARFNDTSFITDIIDKLNDNSLDNTKMKILENKNIDWSLPKNNPAILYILEQNKINLFNKILEFEIVKKYINTISTNHVSPLILLTLKNEYDITKKLLNLGADINYGGYEGGFLPINICIKNGNIELLKFFSENKKLNFNKKDDMLNMPIYYLIDFISTNRLLYENDKFNLKGILCHFIKHTDIYKKNKDNISPYDLLLKFDLIGNFKKIIKNNKNKFNNNIIIPEIKNTNLGIFNSDSVHNIIYSLYILKKYNNTIFPFQLPIKEKQIWESQFVFTLDPLMNFISKSISTHNKFFYCFLPSILYWKDKEKYYKAKNIDFYIKRALNIKNIRFIILKISLVPNSSSFHANIIIFDKKENKIIRFEPYGDWEIVDSYQLDKMIKRIFKKVTNDKLKFIRPGQYLHNPKFQSASEGDYKKNLGDPIGYCLAWCYWFIELKLKNPDISEKELVETALENILQDHKKSCQNDNNCLLGYIRGYAKNLDDEKNNILKEIGFDNKEIYSLTYNEDKLNKIKIYIEKYIYDDILKR
jgi:ankyrin repeat protein